MVPALVLLGLFLLVVPALLRANEVCAISVRDARMLLYRGRAPRALLSDIEEVVRRAKTTRATIRIVKEGGAPRIDAQGVDAVTAQQLRNVLGAYPYRLFVAAQPPKGRNLGQKLGIAWLAWRLAK